MSRRISRYSATEGSNNLVSSSQSVFFGPICIEHLDIMTLTIKTTSSIAPGITIQKSPYKEGPYKAFTADSDLSASTVTVGGVLSVNIVDNGHGWMRILGSSTATISATSISVIMTGRKNS